MRLLALMLVACTARPLDLPEPCCTRVDGVLTCHDDRCPELEGAVECDSLANAVPTFCQLPLTDYCEVVNMVYNPHSSTHAGYQTVFCF